MVSNSPIFIKPSELTSFLEADSDLVCQPGIGWVDINETLKEKGIPLFFPVRPFPLVSICSLKSTFKDRSCPRSNDWWHVEYWVLWK